MSRVIRRLGQTLPVDASVSNGVAAEFLNLHPATLSNMADRGEVPHTKRILKRAAGERIYVVSQLIEWAKHRNIKYNDHMLEESPV